MNKESFSGVLYKGFEWDNYWGRTDKYLKKLDISKIEFKKENETTVPIITKLVVNSERV